MRFGRRDYDAAVGRWTTPDPVRFVGRDTNLFAYVGNSPINRVDPAGLDWVDNTLYYTAQFSAGFGDAFTFGLTRFVRRRLGFDSVIDRCGWTYRSGEVGGVAAQAALLAELAAGATAAEGAAAEGTASGEASFFDGTRYTDKVVEQMSKGPGDFHSFPESVRAFEDAGSVRSVIGNDGVAREMLEIPGSYAGKTGGAQDGVFQFMKESNGDINHRLFLKN